MPAHRKYTDEQRASIYRLWHSGLSAMEITRRSAAGSASVAPFEIPRRTVQAICSTMDKEAGAIVPTSLEEAMKPECVATNPRAVLGFISTEVGYLRALQKFRGLDGGGLEVEEIRHLREMVETVDALPGAGRQDDPASYAEVHREVEAEGEGILATLARQMQEERDRHDESELEAASDASDADGYRITALTGNRP